MWGSGRTDGEEMINIKIPAGVSEGMQLSLNGKGHAGEKEGDPGSLLIVIEEIPHEDLERDGSNIFYELNINFADAVLGTAEVPTLTGKARINIPKGTQRKGKIFRLKQKACLH